MTNREMSEKLSKVMNEMAVTTDVKGQGSVLFESYCDRYSRASMELYSVIRALDELADKEDYDREYVAL